MGKAVAIAVGGITALAVAGSAQAGWRIDRAQQIAAVVWHHPCAGNMRILWEPMPNDVAGAAAWADVDRCAVVLDSDRPVRWEEFCTIVLHEAGHLSGYHDWTNTADPDHASNPRSVMSTNRDIGYDTNATDGERIWYGVDARCRERGSPYLRTHSGSTRYRGV